MSDEIQVVKNLQEAAEIFKQRNEIYSDGYKISGKLHKILFPDGLFLKTEEDFHRYSMFRNCLTKLVRYSANITKGGHPDSADDLMVYASMLKEATEENNPPSSDRKDCRISEMGE